MRFSAGSRSLLSRATGSGETPNGDVAEPITAHRLAVAMPGIIGSHSVFARLTLTPAAISILGPPEQSLTLLTKPGKLQFLVGIESAVQHAQLDSAERIYPLAQTLTNGFRTDRNPISHGARYEYQTAKLSVQGLLMIRMLAEEIVSLESVP
jgi:hypothetical protein